MLLRNIVFGIEDSLVSTVGLLSGIATAGVSGGTIVLTGTVLIFVEAFSMAVGSFLSEDSVETYVTRVRNPLFASILGGGVMFFSYFVFGFMPLLPYVFFSKGVAFITSICIALFALFLLGALSAKMFRAHFLKQGIKMLLIGGAAIGIGILVGNFLPGEK